MVKVTVGEMSYEGTAEEIKELFEVLGAEFPNNSEAVEDSDEVTKPSFKDGDISVVTGGTNCGGIGKGEKVRVTRAELDADGELRISLLDGSDFDWAKPEALELVVDEEETTLKNGDKVRLLHGGNEGSAQGFYNEKIYEVVDVNWVVRDGEHRVCIGEVGGTNEGYVDIEQLEKVLEGVTEQVPTEEIEVGDIITTKHYGILEVLGVNDCDSHEIKVKLDGYDDGLKREACTLVAKKSDRKDI